jgi:hypothetical protein
MTGAENPCQGIQKIEVLKQVAPQVTPPVLVIWNTTGGVPKNQTRGGFPNPDESAKI